MSRASRNPTKQRLLENVSKRAYGLEHRYQQPGLGKVLRAAYLRKEATLEDIFTTRPYELVYKFADRLQSLNPDTYLHSPSLVTGGRDAWRGSFQEVISDYGEALREIVSMRLKVEYVPNAVLLNLVTLEDVRAVLGDPDTLID